MIDKVLMDCARHGMVEHHVYDRHTWGCAVCIDQDYAAEQVWLDAQDTVRTSWAVPDDDPHDDHGRWLDDSQQQGTQ